MTPRTLLALTLALALALSLTTLAHAQQPKPAAAKPPEKPKPTYLTPDDAPDDFKIQGEYLPTNNKPGVQVIALGDDRFRAVIYPSGLPGAGWNGDRSTKVELDGTRANKKVTFTGKGWTAEIVAEGAGRGAMDLKTAEGATVQLTKIVRPSPTLNAKPPQGAKVLYASPEDAQSKWQGGHADPRGLLAAGCKTRDTFKDFTLHVEFLLPFKPLGRGQDRGNSGVYLQDRYECQVLDSFGLDGKNNECGGFYQQFAPSVNMCLPPLQWQTYDIDFTAARFDAAGNKTAKAKVTVRHNGILIHDNVELAKPTPGGGLSGKDTADPGPIQLQGHGNPVFFRNIWILEK